MPVNEQVMDSVTSANTKQLGDGPAVATNIVYQAIAQALALAAQNMVTAQQHMQGVMQAATTAGIDRLLHTQPLDAIAANKLMTGNDVASQMQSLLAALASGQQATKTAQSTPPETAKPE